MLVAAVVLATACSSEGGLMAVATTTPPPPSDVSFSVTGTTVESVRLPPPPFPDDVKDSVAAALDFYLQEAVLRPLHSGGPAGDLGPVFTGSAQARVNGPDRAALVDEGLPPAESVTAEKATVGLAALAGADGAINVVTAAVDLRLEAGLRGPNATAGDDDPVTIARTGHLVLVPDAGGWRIDGYDVRTTRDGGSGATTTTAHG
jgi:hypothetical protein